MNKLLFTRKGNRIIVLTIVSAAALLFIINTATGGFLLEKLAPTCVFHAATGYNCPGCGTTRGLNALLHLNIKAALWYNPATMLIAAVFLVWFIWFAKNAFIGKYKTPFSSKACIVVGVVTCIFLLLFGFVRNTDFYKLYFF